MLHHRSARGSVSCVEIRAGVTESARYWRTASTALIKIMKIKKNCQPPQILVMRSPLLSAANLTSYKLTVVSLEIHWFECCTVATNTGPALILEIYRPLGLHSNPINAHLVQQLMEQPTSRIRCVKLGLG